MIKAAQLNSSKHDHFLFSSTQQMSGGLRMKTGLGFDWTLSDTGKLNIADVDLTSLHLGTAQPFTDQRGHRHSSCTNMLADECMKFGLNYN